MYSDKSPKDVPRRDYELPIPDRWHNILCEGSLLGLSHAVSEYNHLFGRDCKLSGSAYAVSEIKGALPLIHGPTGCSFHQRLTPGRLYEPIYRLANTNITERDVIYGSEETLREQIKNTYKRYHPSLIAILPTCVSALIGDDIPGICQGIKSQVPCDLIYVDSKGFSNRSRESMDDSMQEAAKSWIKPQSTACEVRGCGQEEVVKALIDQLMEEKDIIENSVNLEIFGRYRGCFERCLAETKKIFADIGIRVNTTILGCTVDDIKRAPAAQLNIIMRDRMAATRMKEKFGTEYFRKGPNHYGIYGTERFFLEVASALSLEGEAESALKSETKRALEKIAGVKRCLINKTFAVFAGGFLINPHLTNVLKNEIGVNIKYFVVNTQSLRSMNASDETLKIMLKNMAKLIDEWELGFEFVINPTTEAAKAISKKVDYILSDRPLPENYATNIGTKVINLSPISHLLFLTSFKGCVDVGTFLVMKTQNRTSIKRNYPIISRFRYNPIGYPLIQDDSCVASFEMWSEMWSEMWCPRSDERSNQ